MRLSYLGTACWGSCWSLRKRKYHRCDREFVLLTKPKTRCYEVNRAMSHLPIGQTTKTKHWLVYTSTVPDRPWQDESMDFVLGLSKTEKYDSIFVVVNHFSKMTHFLPCSKTSDASKIAQIYFDGVVKLHVLSKIIMLDRDVKFMGYFWKTLWHKMVTKLKFSTVFHPQIDGQT